MHSPPSLGRNIDSCITLFNPREKHRETKLIMRVLIIINACKGIILHNPQNGLEYEGFAWKCRLCAKPFL